MARLSPTVEAFRAAFRRPLFTFAEITWRWVVGTTTAVLLLFGSFEFLNTLPVNNIELLFLKSRQPFLVSQAIAHILRGGLYRGFLSLLLACLLICLLWMIAASLGRIGVATAVLDYVTVQIAQKAIAMGLAPGESAPATERSPWPALLRLNFLRISLALATVIALWGAVILAGFASSNADPQPGLVFLIFIPIAAAIGLVWFFLNWLLSLAAVFAVRDAEDAISAIEAAVGLCRQRTGALFAVSFWTALTHGVAFVVATTLVSIPLSLATLLPWRLVVLGMILWILIYLAIADWTYTVRLAGYAFIMQMPESFWMPPPPPVAQPLPLVSQTIDRDELILSDLPNLVTGS